MKLNEQTKYRTPLQKWVDVLSVFDEEDIHEEYEKDDTLFLIKQYARLRLSSTGQLRSEYKNCFKKKCPVDLLKDEIIISILTMIQSKISNSENIPDDTEDMPPMEINLQALEMGLQGVATKLVEGTILERIYRGKTHKVKYLKGKYEYGGNSYSSLTEVAQRITGTQCSGPSFFSRKVKMYFSGE